MAGYRDLKFAASDAACAVLAPLSPEVFADSCARFIDGFWVTLELLVLSTAIGFVLALGCVLARVSGNGILAGLSWAYTYVFRGTPLLVQLWIFYFGIGGLGETTLGPVLWPLFRDAWAVGLLVLTLNTSAYVAEILRGGIVNVEAGQREAARAMGMGWFLTMRRILLPQAIKIAWPAYGNEVVLLAKGSALVSTITVMDLMGQTRTVFARSYDLEIYLYAALLYLMITGVITLIFKGIERRF